MAELLFGSGPQFWPAIPVPGFGYFQAPPGNRALAGGAMGGAASQTLPFASGVMPGMSMPSPTAIDPGSHAGMGWPLGPSNPLGGGVPAFTGTDVAAGVTAQALLATVAMRRGQPTGPTNDQEIEDFIYDVLDILPGANDVEVRCEGGRATLTGPVPHKRLKRDVGEIAWAIPSVNDVQNNITIATRRRSRSAGRESEAAGATGAGRKQA